MGKPVIVKLWHVSLCDLMHGGQPQFWAMIIMPDARKLVVK